MFNPPLLPSHLRSGQSLSEGVENAMLAHDIRGALQGVIGGIATIDPEALPPAVQEQFNRIATAGYSLAALIDLKLGEGELREDRISFARLRPLLVSRWKGEAQAKGGTLEVNFAPDLPTGLRFAPVMLARLIDNLLSNAFSHTDRGRVHLVIDCHDGGGVQIRVSDNGSGIPQEVIDRVMRPDTGGQGIETAVHGIGLHIVRNIVESHGGTFLIEKLPDGGTDITVRLPPELNVYDQVEPELKTEAAVVGHLSNFEKTHGLSGLRVLLAEDNLTNQMVATQMLQALGVSTDISSDGVEALEKFELAEYDLVIVDIEMPRLSGLDVIRRIRARTDRRRSVPIVALTAYALREHRDKIAEAGANGLISKPIVSIDVLGKGLAAHVPGFRRVADAPAPAPVIVGEPPRGTDDPKAEIDLEIYDALSEAIGPEMMDELLEKVVTDLETSGRVLEVKLDPLDMAAIGSASHILISVGGAIGATRLQGMARQVNIASHGDPDAAFSSKVIACMAEIDAAVRFARGKRDAG